MLLVQALKSGETLTVWSLDGNTKRYFEIDREAFDAERADGRWQIHILHFEHQ